MNCHLRIRGLVAFSSTTGTKAIYAFNSTRHKRLERVVPRRQTSFPVSWIS
jgi:hypothetical protein